jgi:hypothetical protein
MKPPDHLGPVRRSALETISLLHPTNLTNSTNPMNPQNPLKNHKKRTAS